MFAGLKKADLKKIMTEDEAEEILRGRDRLA